MRSTDLHLPDPLTDAEGSRIALPTDWFEHRRPQILEQFRAQVYGRAPFGRPDNMTFAVVETLDNALAGEAHARVVQIGYEGPGGHGSIRLSLFIPQQRSGPVPLFLLICNRDQIDLGLARTNPSSFWPVEQILDRGYATAAFQVSDVDPDAHDGFSNGVHGIFDPPGLRRPADAWGTIAAWAWGASRAIDYLEQCEEIDEGRLALLGHSRGGKTALWCGAQDERVALTISNQSGCTGAAIARRRQGETIQDINDRFPHWFCENYRQYNGREDALPVDQHMLIALLAPRLVYIASAVDDAWSDPEGEFLAGVHATPVYDLLGKRGLPVSTMPLPDSPIHEGAIGYHLRTGGHDLIEYDWSCYLDYADRWMG